MPQLHIRQRAHDYAPEARNKSEVQLLGNQRMAAEELLDAVPVQLKVPIAQLVSRPGLKAICDVCGEEVLNEREVFVEGLTLCRGCAGQTYYTLALRLAERLVRPAQFQNIVA